MTVIKRREFEVLSTCGSIDAKTLNWHHRASDGILQSEGLPEVLQTSVNRAIILLLGSHGNDVLKFLQTEICSLHLDACKFANSIVYILDLVTKLCVHSLHGILHRLVKHLEALVDLISVLVCDSVSSHLLLSHLSAQVINIICILRNSLGIPF